MKRWDLLVFCLLFTAIGAGGGWYAARQGQAMDAHDEADPTAGNDAGGPAGLSPATLKNLGVETTKANPTSFVKHRSLPSVIERLPLSERPITAPLGGVLRSIDVEPNQKVAAGEVLLTLVRDPIPRPTLNLTASLLHPSHEVLHGSVFSLRTAQKEATILRSELERLAPYTVPRTEGAPPVLPRQRTIDLQNQLLRAESSFDQARLELEKHGLAKQEIDELLAGNSLPALGESHWRRALEANGLWPAAAEALFQALPANSRQAPWVIATVGEVTATGLTSSALIDWLRREPEAGSSFLEIGALLQQGFSVPSLVDLFTRGAFDSVVSVRVPSSLTDTDVLAIGARIGTHVDPGEVLLTLVDRRRMRFRIPAIGEETGLLLAALKNSDPARGRPLVAGAGPDLERILLSAVTGNMSDQDQRDGGVGFAEVPNNPLSTSQSSNGKPLRTWELREGLKYRFEIPVAQFDDVYVFPSEAIVSEGSAQIVLMKDGKTFRAVEVELAYRGHDVAVIPARGLSELYPGDTVVTQGAFALRQAIADRAGSVDPHAGHSH